MNFILNHIEFFTLLGTIFVALMSYLNNKNALQQQKKLADTNTHANLISKARIEWIQEVRKLMAKFIQKSRYYPFLYNNYLESEGTTKEELEKTINQELVEIQYYSDLLLLYFADNRGNKEIRKAITEVIKYLNDFAENDRTEGIEFRYYDKSVTDLLKIATDYFKTEWTRAKNKE